MFLYYNCVNTILSMSVHSLFILKCLCFLPVQNITDILNLSVMKHNLSSPSPFPFPSIKANINFQRNIFLSLVELFYLSVKIVI